MAMAAAKGIRKGRPGGAHGEARVVAEGAQVMARVKGREGAASRPSLPSSPGLEHSNSKRLKSQLTNNYTYTHIHARTCSRPFTLILILIVTLTLPILRSNSKSSASSGGYGEAPPPPPPFGRLTELRMASSGLHKLPEPLVQRMGVLARATLSERVSVKELQERQKERKERRRGEWDGSQSFASEGESDSGGERTIEATGGSQDSDGKGSTKPLELSLNFELNALTHLPNEIILGQCDRLTVLRLQRNHLTDICGPALGQCRALKVLDLRHNR